MGQQPLPTKGLSRKAKGREQHLQLQAHYQQSLMDHMQDRVHEEVSAALLPWAGEQQQQQQHQQARSIPTTMTGLQPEVQQPKVEQMEVQGMGSQGQKALSVDATEGMGQVLQTLTGAGDSTSACGGQWLSDIKPDIKPCLAPVVKEEEEHPVNKLETRRDRNREHARKCRLRKKLLVVSQQQRLAELEHTNRALVQALYRVAPADDVNAILAGAVQGGMAAAMKPMCAPQLPISQRQKGSRGAPAAKTLLDEEGISRRGLGSSDNGPSDSGAGAGPAKAKQVQPYEVREVREVQGPYREVQAAHLGAELAVLDKLKRSLQIREEQAAEMERELKKRADEMLAAEKKYAVGMEQLAAFAQQQTTAFAQQQTTLARADRVRVEAKFIVENPNAATGSSVRAEAKSPDRSNMPRVPSLQCNMHRVPSMQWDVNADETFEAVDDLMQFLDANPEDTIETETQVEGVEGHGSIPRVASTQWDLM
jgi:hypothetical protein